ncbi:SEL1-like repeat protein [Salmonella enterica]|uniref:tetratricopeptide repeat protein n=1 Tax=Salmonella enterica TaxID=28901 RepID=UPI0021D49705|nr:SEL1-like repeat protein [Salmonella enterica]MCU7121802.1 SEL1-like repeat protein [Salmonella enterica]MDO3817486.1 SEL1-like repeat protein [Salmonella enterica]MDO3826625.1 SEL1-like repeat protein [Salmonella enterica]
MKIKFLSLCILAGILFVSQVNASENNGKDDVKYAALTKKDIDALPVEKRASVLDELGFIHEYGIGVPMNRERALQYYKQACELGGNYGCYNVKYAYQYGDGVAKDSAQANKYAKKMNLDNLLIEQEYIDKFSQEIFTAKALADTDKSQRAAFISILIHALNNRPESDVLFFSRIGFNQEKTFRLATLWVQDGDPQMDYQMGRLTLNDFSGRYADEPYKARPASLKWFRAAAEKGVVEAQSLLGGIYSGGEGDEWGIKPDIQEAQKWYGQAAEQGDSDAQIALGKIYYSGATGRTDYAKALALFTQVENDGTNSRSTMPLSWMYYNGLGTAPDCDKAWSYYKKASRYVGKKVEEKIFLSKCAADIQSRKNNADALPKVTLKKESIFSRGITAKPKECALIFQIGTDKIRNMANLHITLELKNDDGMATEETLMIPPFGLNTLGIDMQNHDVDPLVTPYDLPLYTQDFCHGIGDIHFTLKSATATINGKNVDLLKADSVRFLDKE